MRACGTYPFGHRSTCFDSLFVIAILRLFDRYVLFYLLALYTTPFISPKDIRHRYTRTPLPSSVSVHVHGDFFQIFIGIGLARLLDRINT